MSRRREVDDGDLARDTRARQKALWTRAQTIPPPRLKPRRIAEREIYSSATSLPPGESGEFEYFTNPADHLIKYSYLFHYYYSRSKKQQTHQNNPLNVKSFQLK
ncbi:hypothetical protein [Burkholderia sp. WAC0059]|uniref:hypothetical protein n=1 Tax=Burkholderia sp. WAC0059 TaxID=2066022 RepID=UPI0011AFC837|nr:hypothetical protein [Burkholderia sp. WAC0059]